jgi:hypothetical protein
LVPLTVGLEERRIIVEPIWGPNDATARTRVLTISARVDPGRRNSLAGLAGGGTTESDRVLLTTWFLTDRSP